MRISDWSSDVCSSDLTRPFGLVGLGRMGGGLARQALENGLSVVGFDAAGISDELLLAGLKPARSVAAFAADRAPPRAVLLYIPAGQHVDAGLDHLLPVRNIGKGACGERVGTAV